MLSPARSGRPPAKQRGCAETRSPRGPPHRQGEAPGEGEGPGEGAGAGEGAGPPPAAAQERKVPSRGQHSVRSYLLQTPNLGHLSLSPRS